VEPLSEVSTYSGRTGLLFSIDDVLDANQVDVAFRGSVVHSWNGSSVAIRKLVGFVQLQKVDQLAISRIDCSFVVNKYKEFSITSAP